MTRFVGKYILKNIADCNFDSQTNPLTPILKNFIDFVDSEFPEVRYEFSLQLTKVCSKMLQLIQPNITVFNLLFTDKSQDVRKASLLGSFDILLKNPKSEVSFLLLKLILSNLLDKKVSISFKTF